MIWENPEWLFALILIPVAIAVQWYFIRSKRTPAMVFSRNDAFKEFGSGWRVYGRYGLYLLQTIAATLIIVSLARPQLENVTIERNVEGIDIILVIDISSSMLAEDLKPNRFIAVRDVAANFVDKRPNDRIGLVVFARESITLVPPTLDHRLVRNQLSQMDMGIVRDGTAIGMGVATAANRLRDSTADSRVIVLLTDGENNAGEIDPITSSEIAAALGIRMYTIGASTGEATAPYPIDDPVFGRRYYNIRVEIDEPMLTEMAQKTGGRYFRARDNRELEQVYAEIDQLETSTIDEIIYRDRVDQYQLFLFPGVALLLLTMLLGKTIFRSEL
jgi:Ca-activated chloride channel family protein